MNVKGKGSKTIVVTGDFTVDWNIARIRCADGAGYAIEKTQK